VDVRVFNPMAKVITDKALSDFELEFARWAEFLNAGVGLVAFNLGISCLGTPHPAITAAFSIGFLLVFMGYGFKYFPQKIRKLRGQTLSGVDEVALLGIEKKYFGVCASFTKYPIYTLGWLFLLGVFVYGVISGFAKP